MIIFIIKPDKNPENPRELGKIFDPSSFRAYAEAVVTAVYCTFLEFVRPEAVMFWLKIEPSIVTFNNA